MCTWGSGIAELWRRQAECSIVDERPPGGQSKVLTRGVEAPRAVITATLRPSKNTAAVTSKLDQNL